MTYKLLEKFKEIIGDDPVFTIHATIAPILMSVAWKRGEDDPIHSLSIVKNRDTYFCINEKRYFALATDVFRKYHNGEVSIGELEAEYQSYERHTGKIYTEVTDKDLSELSDAELKEYIEKIDSLYAELLETVYIETIDYDKILSVIGEERKSELDAVWEKATESTFVSFEGRYLRNILDIVSSEQANAVRKAKFIFTDYFWTKSDEEITAAFDAVRRDLDKKRKEADQIEVAARDKKDAFVAWEKTLDPETRRIVDYIQLMMYMRDARKDPIAQMLAVLMEVATVMVKRAGIALRYAPFISLHEYMRGVEHLKKMKDDIETREQGCLYLAHPDGTYEIEHCDFDKALTEFNEWTKQHLHDTDEFKGQIACRGLVRGTARVISDPQDDKGFMDGDILVTSMTRPEFVPIMKRAGAVVTNEGGITCHAAIVSRELGIPCIIGTKHATHILHDGDLVEVDANKGVVTILKRK